MASVSIVRYSEDGRITVLYAFTIENEPGNLTLVKMTAVSVVLLGGIDFHGITDLAAANGSMQVHRVANIDQLYDDNGVKSVQFHQSPDANPF